MDLPIYDVSKGGRAPLERFGSAVNQAIFSRRLRANPGTNSEDARYDSADGWVAAPRALEGWRSRQDGAAFRQLVESGWRPGPNLLDRIHAINPRSPLLNQRADAFDIGAGAFPRDLEFLRQQILQEARIPLTADMCFATDTSVPLGAQSHAVRRALGSGEAQIYAGGADIPVVGHTYVRETYGVVYVVSSVETNFLSLLATDFANLRAFQQDLGLAFRVVDEKLDELAWYGDPSSNIYGVLNYPSIDKYTLAQSFASGTVDQIAAACSDFLTQQMVTSVGTFYADSWVVSPKTKRIITSARFTANAPGATIESLVVASSGGRIKEAQVSPRLAGVGPGGTDAMVAYRRDLSSLAQVKIQASMTLPVYQSSPMDQQTVVMGCTGGMVSFDSGNNLVGYVTVP